VYPNLSTLVDFSSFFSLFALGLGALGSAHSGHETRTNVKEVSAQSTWDSTIGKGVPALVEFFAPWCGHCKNLAPKYEELADAFEHAKDKVIIAKVDADGEGKSLGQKYEVKGYPTLKWFDKDGNMAEEYEGGRELEDLVKYITEKTGVKSKLKQPTPSEVTSLIVDNFDSIALDDTKDVLVTFTAPWCGHCKSLKPVYENVARYFREEKNCIVANMDADAAHNKPVAQKYGVSSFPTIKFFGKGEENKEPISYTGGRSEQAFVDFLNEKCGTHRAVGGGLNDLAGRIPSLDELAQKFIDATTDVRTTILGEAAILGKEAKHYIRVMEKITEKSNEYITKELKRLQSILAKGTLGSQKLDEIKIKTNILSAFIKKEESAEKLSRAEDEL